MTMISQVLRHKGREVRTIAPGATVLEALRQMAERNIGALVVVEGDQVIGLLSERDYAREGILKGRASKDTPVRDVMSRHVVCVSLRHTVHNCMALMTEKRQRHLPVLDAGHLVGIISIGDVVKAIIEDQQDTIEQLEHYITGSR